MPHNVKTGRRQEFSVLVVTPIYYAMQRKIPSFSDQHFHVHTYRCGHQSTIKINLVSVISPGFSISSHAIADAAADAAAAAAQRNAVTKRPASMKAVIYKREAGHPLKLSPISW